MFPKWLGSSFQDLEDYVFGDIKSNGIDQIISIEFMENGKKYLHHMSGKALV